MEFLSFFCPQYSWSKMTVSAAAKKKKRVNVFKHQTLEESEEGGGGGGDVGRPTTGQTNTSWFLFSMATWWLCIDPQVPQVQTVIVNTHHFLPYKHLARSKRKIVQEILFFLSITVHFFILYVLFLFFFILVPVYKKRGPVQWIQWVWGLFRVRACGVVHLVTVVNEVIVARLFGNRGRGLWNLDVL